MSVPEPDTVPSPCIDVCELDANDVCIGCLRSSADIMAWPTLDNDGKRAVLARIARATRSNGGPTRA